MNFKMSTVKYYLLIVCSVVFITACEQQSSVSNVNDTKSNKPIIALIMKSLANEFFVVMGRGATEHQKQNSDQYELILNGIKDESDLAQQVVLIDQMVAAGVDAIVIAPADSKAVVPALARARDAGVYVVNIDNKLDDSVLAEYSFTVPFVGPDNRQGAKSVASTLLSTFAQGTQVAILEGVPTAFNSQQRVAGFEDSIKEHELTLVDKQSAAWDQTKAVSITSALLIKYPELKAILAANDNMAIGAISAITQARKTGQVDVVGFDNISAAQRLINEGKMFATADQHGDQLAVFGIEFALEAIAGNKTQVVNKNTPVDIVLKK